MGIQPLGMGHHVPEVCMSLIWSETEPQRHDGHIENVPMEYCIAKCSCGWTGTRYWWHPGDTDGHAATWALVDLTHHCDPREHPLSIAGRMTEQLTNLLELLGPDDTGYATAKRLAALHEQLIAAIGER